MDFTLRPWNKNDMASAFFHSNNPKIQNFMSDAFPNSLEKWERFFEFVNKDNSRLYLAIEIDGEAAGSIGISPCQGILRKNAELGYWLSEKYWGKGIITQAIKKVVQLAFEKFDIDRIYATPFETNHASHRVLEKAGFALEARFSKIVIKNGERLDELVYAIRKQDDLAQG